MIIVGVLYHSTVQDEDEVPDDETINQMLARTENEYEKFQVEFPICELHYLVSILLLLFIMKIVHEVQETKKKCKKVQSASMCSS